MKQKQLFFKFSSYDNSGVYYSSCEQLLNVLSTFDHSNDLNFSLDFKFRYYEDFFNFLCMCRDYELRNLR